MMFMDRAERRARFDRLQLLRIADQHDLRARVGGMGEDAFHLACADHPRLIDDEAIARTEQIAPLRPAMFEARGGARRDARAALQTLGGDARERRTAHKEPPFYPHPPPSPKHTPLAGPPRPIDKPNNKHNRTPT